MAHLTSSGPCLGPPPICDIFPVRATGLPDSHRRKILLIRRKIRQLQEKALGSTSHIRSPDTAAGSSNADLPVEAFLSSPLTGYEVNWIMDDSSVLRFLLARDWHVSKALRLLLDTVKFRRSTRPERIRPKEVAKTNSNGQLYRRGFDRQGHPIIYMRPAKNDPSLDPDAAITTLVYMLERAVQSMDRHTGVSAICFVIDYNGYTNTNQPALPVALRFIDIFQNHYPERLAMAFLVDTPWYFGTFWNCINPFLPTRTVTKIKFLSTKEPKDVDEIIRHIDPKYVEGWIPGGQANTPYDHAAYWAEENRQYETYMKFLQEEFVCKSQAQRLAEARAFADAQSRGDDPRTAVQTVTVIQSGGGNDAGEAALLETEEGEDDIAEDDDDSPDTAEFLEDEKKRLMLQEALERGAPAPSS